MSSVLIVAAEASSVLYAQRLLEYWKQEKEVVTAFGIGSKEMEQIGFERFGKSEEMAVMGIAEVLQHYNFIKSVFYNLLEEVKKRKPQVAILMDYPGFNLRLAKELHALGIPVIYYISPQVWAWRKNRVYTIKKYCQKVLLLFPFEVAFYKEKGVPYEFVGHPILDELDAKLLDPEYLKIRRNQCGISDQEIVLGLMPGSRRMELKQNFSVQLEVARRLVKKYSQLKVLIMAAPNFEKEDLLPYLEDFRVPYMLIKDDPFRMIHLTDICLVTSGTATLMVGLLRKPMIIMYRLKWLTALVAKVVVRGTRFFGLVNLIRGKEVVPECYQKQVDPDYITPLVERYINDIEYRNSVKNELAQLEHQLGDRGVTPRVAKAIACYLSRPGEIRA